MKLTSLLNATLLKEMLAQKYVKAQSHPVLPLTILNYTNECMWDKAWNDVTKQCRGLIYDHDGFVVARPWTKFFNYGEYDAGDQSALHQASRPAHKTLDMVSSVETTDKQDGSLGILYPTPQGHSIATRGSFTSEQAVRASFLWYKKGYNEFPVPDGWTVLLEIIYPGNRIVLDYGDQDDLVLLGAVNIETGEAIGPDSFFFHPWPGPRTTVFAEMDLPSALARAPRPNAEGVVVRYMSGPDKGLMVKIKQDDYVLLHRLITGMNARTVWEHLREGTSPATICRGIPEEFWPWVEEVAAELLEAHQLIAEEAYADYEFIKNKLPEGWTRKDFALMAVESEYKAYLFQLLDGKSIMDAIWKNVKPSGERSMKYISEDVA